MWPIVQPENIRGLSVLKEGAKKALTKVFARYANGDLIESRAAFGAEELADDMQDLEHSHLKALRAFESSLASIEAVVFVVSCHAQPTNTSRRTWEC